MLKNNTLAIALASLLVGGVAVAAFQNSRSHVDTATLPAASADAALAAADTAATDSSIPSGGKVEYADVVNVKPVTEKQAQYAQVIGTDPVRESSTTSTPHQVCNDVAVQQQAPTRDPHRITGTAIGAVVGGLVGNQVGGGNGKKLATVGGAVGGAFAGRAIQSRQQANNTVTTTQQQCHTETSTSTSSKTVAWNVTYRNPDGTTGTMRMGSKPGSRISLGSENKTIGYDVTYRYNGVEQTVRMDDKPAGDRLPVIDGQVVTQVASAADGSTHG